jgi:hypothetical protein
MVFIHCSSLLVASLLSLSGLAYILIRDSRTAARFLLLTDGRLSERISSESQASRTSS